MKDILLYLWNRRTTVLGYLGVIMGVLVTSQGLFSERGLRWIVLINGIIIAVLGHYNNSKNPPPDTDNSKPTQNGFTRPLMLALVLAFSTAVLVAPLSGCANTTRAVKNADTPADYALVFLAGYSSALKSANDYRLSGKMTPEELAKIRELELRAYPFIQPIPKLQAAYEATYTAADAAALQKAIDEAVIAAADFIRAVQQLGKGK